MNMFISGGAQVCGVYNWHICPTHQIDEESHRPPISLLQSDPWRECILVSAAVSSLFLPPTPTSC